VKSESFAYWLQGYLEITKAACGEQPQSPRTLNEWQIACIEKHLAMVFYHDIDPKAGDNNAALNAIHNDKPSTKPPMLGGTTAEGIVFRC